MKKEIKSRIIIGILMLVVMILTALGIVSVIVNVIDNQIKEENDWWTRVFCAYEDGEYQEKFLFDVCIIDGVEHIAYFRAAEYHNETKSGRIWMWQLIRK